MRCEESREFERVGIGDLHALGEVAGISFKDLKIADIEAARDVGRKVGAEKSVRIHGERTGHDIALAGDGFGQAGGDEVDVRKNIDVEKRPDGVIGNDRDSVFGRHAVKGG